MNMASAQREDEFDNWLRKKLVDLNTDDEVFSPYIKGILDSEDSMEEKREGLEGILVEIIENDIQDLCTEILKKYADYLANIRKEEIHIPNVALDEKLAKLMEESKLRTPEVTIKLNNSEQQKLKEAILANYAEVSDGEASDSDDSPCTTKLGVMKNTNAEAVSRAEREKRDKDKEESMKKREKDKEDRAKQKSKDEDRKDKEKKRTQKGEKRR